MEHEYAVFSIGDVISSIMKKEIRVITGIKEGNYEFMNLKPQNYKDVLGRDMGIEKGSISYQPIDIVHAHFSILEL